jgi:hypothetical protein
MDAEVSGAGLGDPFRVRELLLTAVEVAVWEAGERSRCARRLAGKEEAQVDVGAEDLLPLLVLAVSRCAGGYDAVAEASASAPLSTEPDSKPAIPQAPLAPARMRCPWRLPLQTLNYLANFAIGRDSAAGRLSYLVISMHGAVTFVMQRAKEEGAGAAMETLARARRISTARARRAMTAAGPTPQVPATTPVPKSAPRSPAGSSTRGGDSRAFSDSDSDDEGSDFGGDGTTSEAEGGAGPIRSRASGGKPTPKGAAVDGGWSLVDIATVSAQEAGSERGSGFGGAVGDVDEEDSDAEAGDAAMDALEVAEAAVAAQALSAASPRRATIGSVSSADATGTVAAAADSSAAGSASAAASATGPGDEGTAAAGSGESASTARRKRVGVDIAIRKLASLQQQPSSAQAEAVVPWIPGADAADLHMSMADAYADEDEGGPIDDGIAGEGDEGPGIDEDEVTMIAMPGDADRPDKEGMTDLKRWLGQQELLEDTVEILT